MLNTVSRSSRTLEHDDDDDDDDDGAMYESSKAGKHSLVPRVKLKTTAKRSFTVLQVVAGTCADAFKLTMVFLIQILCKSMLSVLVRD
jgi:hypothetical protein